MNFSSQLGFKVISGTYNFYCEEENFLVGDVSVNSNNWTFRNVATTALPLSFVVSISSRCLDFLVRKADDGIIIFQTPTCTMQCPQYHAQDHGLVQNPEKVSMASGIRFH